jgi:TonB family protein
MQIPEEFGSYLLLKKLGEDPLGETFRAGKVGREGLGQVVLLRVWNGRGLEGDRFAEALAARAAVQQALRSPNIGSGVDLGRVRNFSYAAYDYISGKNLETLAAQATRARQPIPPDHALLIVERLALAVAAGYETRVKDERVLHGFVVPQLVMVSNEGETRLLGFEAAPALREAAAAGAFPPEITRYLAPEALAGGAAAKNDDVWSLAAILLELLTGRPLPAAPAEGYGAVVDGAALAQEGSPLPAPLAALLKKSLLPRAERVADAVVWHKTLAKLMIEGHYSPTTFNLAFFMHNLFREDIERESQELQAERKLDLSERVRSAPPPPAAAPVHDVRESTGVREAPVKETTGVYYPGQAAAQKRSKAPLFIGLAAVLAAALGVGGWMMYGRKPQAPPPRQAAAPPPAPRPAPVQPAAPVMTQEQIDAQIKALIEQRSQALEEAYRKQTDEQIRILQRQLEESRKAAAAAAAEREERQAAATTAPPAAAAPDPAAETRAAAARPPAEGAGEPPAQTAALPGQVAAAPASALERHDPPPAATEPAASAPAVPVPAPPPQVRVGDLVTALGPGVVPPQRTSELRAVYPPAAERLRKSAMVNVRVLVDETGKVLQAERIGPTVGFGFDDAAIDAARRVRFRPATKDGIRVKMWTTLRVAFKP